MIRGGQGGVGSGGEGGEVGGENGLIGEKRGRRRWCGGVMVVVVGMEEEMEGRKVEKLVVMVVELEGGWPANGGSMAAFCCHCSLLAAGNKEEERKIMKERGVGVYI